MTEQDLQAVDRKFYRAMLVMFVIISIFIFLTGMGVGAYLNTFREPAPCNVVLAFDRNFGTIPIRCIREAVSYIIKSGE